MWKLAGPRFDVAGRHGNTNSLKRLEVKFRRENAYQVNNRTIVDTHGGLLCQMTSDLSALQAPECLSWIATREVPTDFPQTARPHQAQQHSCARRKQSAQVSCQSIEIPDAIQRAEVRESPAEAVIFSQAGYVLGSQESWEHEAMFSVLLNSASRQSDHVR